MHTGFSLLVADRNPHVREFLKRELGSRRYEVEVAKDGREVLAMLEGDRQCDLVVMDLDLPFVDGLTLLEEIARRRTGLPVVLHGFLGECADHPALRCAAACVEKKGNLDKLFSTIKEVLQRWYPDRQAAFTETGR
jgi:CheY-like chemotaxis protein